MYSTLSANDSLTSVSGASYSVIRSLGSGGQGEVYQVRDGTGHEWALKWYFPASATTRQRKIIEDLVKTGSPAVNFLWPVDLIQRGTDDSTFGYIMQLRPPEYRSLNDLLAGRVKNVSAQSLIRMGIHLARSFRALHTKGLCYQDISFGNAFFRPETGDILICDNDNVTTNRSKVGGVLGTADFMAPEVVRGEDVPSRDTDYHSLAVLLFYIFFLGHPLVGRKVLSIRCWDGPAREKIFGKEPLFIFNAVDRGNEAVAGDPECGGNALVYWRIYPKSIKDAFTKAFTIGLLPHGRMTDLEWLDILTKFQDSLYHCTCGAPNFYDADTVTVAAGQRPECWRCHQVPRLPFRIRIGRSLVMLNADTKLFAHHLNGSLTDLDLATPMAAVTQHPTNPALWGLQNLTPTKWTLTTADGQMRDVEPQRSVPLAPGTRVDFGKDIHGEILH